MAPVSPPRKAPAPEPFSTSAQPASKDPPCQKLLDFDSQPDEDMPEDRNDFPNDIDKEFGGNGIRTQIADPYPDFTPVTHRKSKLKHSKDGHIPNYAFNLEPLKPGLRAQLSAVPETGPPPIQSYTETKPKPKNRQLPQSTKLPTFDSLQPDQCTKQRAVSRNASDKLAPRSKLAESANQDASMNEHLSERFGRRSPAWEPPTGEDPTEQMVMNLNLSIRRYVKAAEAKADPAHWTGFREIPTSAEIFDEGRKQHEDAVEIDENIVAGPYPSREDYLQRHYLLLREDGLAPLRDVISEVQVSPYMMEKDSENNAYIYERVYLTGFTFARTGIAARFTFSLKRVGKQINWEQSKRLITGTIVALTPANAPFRDICRVAVVAARPLAGLQQNPPEIDLFFGGPDEIEVDPQQEWIMVESRNGFYEGHRHVLRGLQMLSKESFPLAEHIVDLEREIKAPKNVEQQPLKDLRKLFPTTEEDVTNINILPNLPAFSCDLDESQKEALHRILARKLAIVQGPPGTGKTHLSIVALRLMLQNMGPLDPPIIVAAHTNHAVDQLLRHISKFEPNFIRLGGMSTDVEIIKPRTLYEIKSAIRHPNPIGSLRGPALATMNETTKELIGVLAPLTLDKEQIPSDVLLNYGVITRAQHESLVKGAKEWFSADSSVEGDMATWLGESRIKAERRVSPEDLGIDFEEVDLEFEQLREIEAETKLIDDEDFETLRGKRTVLSEPWTSRKAMGVSSDTIQAELEKDDMWNIPSDVRGPVYRHLQSQLKHAIRANFRAKAQNYAKAVLEAKIGRWEVDTNFLKQSPIIGMTTTGLSKYRGLLQSLNPRVVLIEEAAETLESYVSVACFNSLEHLILVGDHQQLRGHCHDQGLEGKPFYLDVSMFERLVRNHVDFAQLKRQRGMIPEIRRALNPIYDNLEDHPSVLEHLPVPGMDGINTFFFTHKWRESTDNQMSKTNPQEADMVVEFFNYLRLNGMSPNEITVLTFYNGQRKVILRKLREHPSMRGGRFKVVTVDSFQGEENRIVLMSLVRSNTERKIGFLEVENRVCVALSRAQRGFYIFGDGPNLCKSSMLWFYVTKIMAKDPCRVGFVLPLTCKNHDNATFIKDAKDFEDLDGGCALPCNQKMACGHVCILNCHPFSHDEVNCHKPCDNLIECGHACTQLCYLECKSDCECVAQEVDEVKETNPPLDYAQTLAASLEKKANIMAGSPGKKAKALTESPEKKARMMAGSPEKKAKALTSSPEKKAKQPLGLPQGSHKKPKQQLVGNPMSSFTFPQLPEISNRDPYTGVQKFREYAEGGHVESDQRLADLAAEQQAKTRQDRMDEKNAASLFTPGVDAPPGRDMEEMKLVRTKTDGQGGSRGVWKGTYEAPAHEEDTSPSKDEVSLIEL